MDATGTDRSPEREEEMERLGANDPREPMFGQGDMAPRPGQEGSLPPSDQVPIRRAGVILPGGDPLESDDRHFNLEDNTMTVIQKEGDVPKVYATHQRFSKLFNPRLRQYTDDDGNTHNFNTSQYIGPSHSNIEPPNPNVPAQGTLAPPPAQSPPSQPSSSRQPPPAPAGSSSSSRRRFRKR
jgi:hypothetical protein